MEWPLAVSKSELFAGYKLLCIERPTLPMPLFVKCAIGSQENLACIKEQWLCMLWEWLEPPKEYWLYLGGDAPIYVNKNKPGHGLNFDGSAWVLFREVKSNIRGTN